MLNQVNSTSLNSLKRRRLWPWFVFIGIALILIIGAIVAIISENKHREIATLYANAIAIYSKVDITETYNKKDDILIDSTKKAFQAVIDKDSGYIEHYLSYLQIALLENFTHQPDEAIKYLKYIKSAPKTMISKVQAMNLLARIYMQQDRLAEALEIYEYIEGQASGEALNFVRYQLGIIYSSQKNTMNKAIPMYSKIDENSSLNSLAKRNIFMLKAISQNVKTS